ncbi:MAG: ESPR-type extended signal peptide-containing protein, partial [Pelistega sp.]|nr:ESPR-type extended signal peptide-containing protein [Pelistega sp.]
MNKSYRSVWNEALGAWVAVSEIEGGRSKNSVSSLGSEFDDVTSRPALTLNNIAKVTFLGLLSLVGNNALAQQDVIGTIKFDVLANTSTKMRTIQSTGHVADLTTTAYSNAMTGASAGNTSGFIYSNGDFSSAYTGYWYNDDRKGKSRVVFSPVKTEVKKVNSLGTQTAEVRVLGTKIGDKSVSALSDNLSFANNYDSRFMNSGLSDGISYSLLQDDIIQVNFNEHAKAINTLTEITKTHHDQIQTGSKEPITFVADIGSVSRKLGETLNVKTVGAKYGTYSGDNLRTTITGDTLNIEFNNDPNFNSLTTTQDVKVGGSMLVKGHSTMKGGATVYQKLAVKPYASVDMGSNVINHVGAGVVDSDAVNLGQLKNVQQTAEKGWNIQANNDLATRVGPGETVQFLDGQNIDVTRQGHNVTIATADDVSFSTLQVTGQTTLGNLSIKKNSQVNLGGNKITNLGDGVADSDAVTIKQLNEATMAAGKQPTTSAGKNITVEKRTDSLGGIDYKVSTADDLVVNSVVAGVSTLNRTGLHIAGGPSITTAGVNAGGKTITNVAPGVYPRDAVNVSQLEDVKGIATKGWELSTNTGATTNVAPGDTVDFVEGQNIKLSNTGRTVTVASASDVNFNNVTVTGDTHVNNLTATGVTNLQNVNVAGDSIFNGGATFNEGLTVNNNFTVGGNTTIDMGGNKITNIKEGDSYHDAVNYGQVTNMYNNLANKPMSFAGNTGSVDRKLGETLNITGSASTAGNYSGSNVKVVADAAGIQVQFAENPVFNSVSTVGDANIGGNANIVGNTTIGGGATVGGDLSVAGSTTVNNLSVNANSLVDLGG